MIAIIRIAGQVGLNKDIRETLNRLKIKRKYTCTIIKEKQDLVGMVKKVSNFVAYGTIKKEVFLELLKKRAKLVDKSKKVDFEEVAKQFQDKDKKLSDLNIKPFFGLHPPRGGIKSKEHFPKGVLGNNNEKINDLIKRML